MSHTRFGGRRLRIGRHSEANRLYLVTTVTYDRRPLFRELHLGRVVVRALMGEMLRTETVCYVVMPDHVHWLLQLKPAASLSSVIQRVKSVTAHRLRRMPGASRGPVWQKGFHDHALRHDEDVKAVARYVVANPLRAGLVERIGAYPLWDAMWLDRDVNL
ncbi:MAG TPA: transposase [Gammaproteobacteria bacterium]|nr:transposase [Gammaproteobacteria bacterium]